MTKIFTKDEIIFLIKMIYILIIGGINDILITHLSKYNFNYYYVLGLPNAFLLLFVSIYYYKFNKEVKMNIQENKKSEDLKRFGLV